MGLRGRIGIALTSAMLLCGAIAAPAGAKAGDVWVLDDNNPLAGAIWKLGPAGGAPSLFTSGGFDDPGGFAYDRNGDLLVTDEGLQGVFKIDLPSGSRTVYASGPPFQSPERIALGPDGAAYVTDLGGTDDLFRIDPITGAVTTVATEPAIQAPRGIAITRAGVAYVGTMAIDGIYRVDLATGAVSTAAPSPLLGSSGEVTLTADERALYVARRLLGDERVIKVDFPSAAVTSLAEYDEPNGIGLLRSGSLLIGNNTTDQIDRMGASGSPVTSFSPGPGFGGPVDVLVDPGLCDKRFPTVAGTDAAEVLQGSPFADVIRGEGGKDQINGLGGKDVICGGKGKDLIRGGASKDVLRGEGGRDRLVGGKGKDSCNGGKGTDSNARGCEKVAKVP